MMNITLNHKNNTIVVTKKFYTASTKYGSQAYDDLKSVKEDYPTYKVVVKKTAAGKKEHYKGLTYNFMKKYIASHDDDNQSIMNEFMILRGTSFEAEDLELESSSYDEIKTWFLAKYPAIAEYQNKREAILNSVKKAA